MSEDENNGKNEKIEKGKTADDVFAETRMSFGDHLMDLRSRLIKSIYGLLVGFVISIFFGGDIIEFIATPMLLALEASGYEPEFYASAAPEAFITYIKVCIFSGIFISSPWIFYQLWNFIAVGLYPRERRYVNLFVPFSAALFMLGGIFLIYIVAPISFNFFITFGARMQTPDISDSKILEWILRIDKPDEIDKTIPEDQKPPTERIKSDPCQVGDTTLPLPTESDDLLAPLKKPLIKPLFTIQKYISLVTWMALAFGVAFQMPLAVFLLGRLGLVDLSTFKSTRKYIFFGIVIFSAMITPPDVISQIALATPMYILYEVGILMLLIWPKRKIS